MGKTKLERKILENEYIYKAGPHATEDKIRKIREEDGKSSKEDDGIQEDSAER